MLENSAVPVLMEMLDTAPDEQNITIIVNAVQRHSLLSGDYNCNVLMFSIFINANCFTTSLGLSFEGVLCICHCHCLFVGCFLITLNKLQVTSYKYQRSPFEGAL